MKKTIYIIGGVVAAALIFVTVMLLTDKENPLELENPVVAEETRPDIDFYEDFHQEGFINDSTAPAKSVKIEEGKVVYVDGTEKSWLDIYKEELDKPAEQKTFSFVEGTTLMTSFNANTDFAKIIVPEGIKELESSFNNIVLIYNITPSLTHSIISLNFCCNIINRIIRNIFYCTNCS